MQARGALSEGISNSEFLTCVLASATLDAIPWVRGTHVSNFDHSNSFDWVVPDSIFSSRDFNGQ